MAGDADQIHSLHADIEMLRRKEQKEMMLYRKTKASEPSSLAYLQHRKKLALDQERMRLKLVYEQKLAREKEHFDQLLQRELEVKDSQLRATFSRSSVGGPKYSSLTGFAGQSAIGAHITREQRAAFRCVTTDEIPGQTIQKIIGMVSGSYLHGGEEDNELGEPVPVNKMDRSQAQQALTDAALRLGANAVVALRFDTAPLGDLTEINAYGTAVVTIDTKDAKKGGKGGEGNDNNNNGKKGNDSLEDMLKRALMGDTGKNNKQKDDGISYSQIENLMKLLSNGPPSKTSGGWGNSNNSGNGWSSSDGGGWGGTSTGWGNDERKVSFEPAGSGDKGGWGSSGSGSNSGWPSYTNNNSNNDTGSGSGWGGGWGDSAGNLGNDGDWKHGAGGWGNDSNPNSSWGGNGSGGWNNPHNDGDDQRGGYGPREVGIMFQMMSQLLARQGSRGPSDDGLFGWEERK